MQRHILEKIVAFGVAAPSGDNCQSWDIEFHDGMLRLLSIPAKDLPYLKIGTIAAFLSFGALLENMDIACGSLGYAMQTNLFPDPKNPLLIAECRFQETPVKNDPLFPAIMERRANRRPYAEQPLSPAVRSNILEQSSRITGPTLHLFERNSPEFQNLAHLTRIGDQLFFENKTIHDYLFAHLRWDDFSAQQTKDGMHVKTLELGNVIMNTMFRFLFKPWVLVSFFNAFGASWFIGRRGMRLNQKSSAFVLINVPQTSPNDYVAAGRLMQKVWLAATVCGLTMQPTASISLSLHAFKLGHGPFSPRHIRLLSQAETLMDSIIPGQAGLPLMMFRVGRARPPSGPSWRRIYQFQSS